MFFFCSVFLWKKLNLICIIKSNCYWNHDEKKYFEPEIYLNCILSKSTVSRLSIICISECKYVQWNIGLFEYQNEAVWRSSRHPVCGIGKKAQKTSEKKWHPEENKWTHLLHNQRSICLTLSFIKSLSTRLFEFFSSSSLVPSWQYEWDKKNTQCCEKM